MREEESPRPGDESKREDEELLRQEVLRRIEQSDVEELLVVGGPTASGKSTIADAVEVQFPGEVVRPDMDNYYHAREKRQELEAAGKVSTFDEPNAIGIDELVEDIVLLLQGVTAFSPEYCMKQKTRTGKKLELIPQKKVLLEGILALEVLKRLLEKYPEIKKLIRIKALYATAPRHLRKKWRKKRDRLERQRSDNDFEKQWPTVVDGEEKYIEPTEQYADETVTNEEIDDFYDLPACEKRQAGFVQDALAYIESTSFAELSPPLSI